MDGDLTTLSSFCFQLLLSESEFQKPPSLFKDSDPLIGPKIMPQNLV